MELDGTNNLQELQSMATNSLPTCQEIIEEIMTRDTTTTKNTLPYNWTDVTTTGLLQAMYARVEEVNNKVDEIAAFLKIPKKRIPKNKSQTTTTAITTTTAGGCCVNDIPPVIKQKAYDTSSSRGNFAKNLVFLYFTPEERKGRNCTGRSTTGAPVEPLDQIKLTSVKNCVFEVYGVPPNLQEKVWREECVKAIDSSVRKERFKQKKVN